MSTTTIDTPFPVGISAYKKTPVSFGFEIEQKGTDIMPRLRDVYHWHIDGSGPLETTLDPSAQPARKVKKFVEACRQHGTWSWKGEYQQYGEWKGCGSHIHFRVRDHVVEEEHIEPNVAWAVTWNTLLCASTLLCPMMAYGNHIRNDEFTFRRSVLRWADIETQRKKARTMGYYRSGSYFGREYRSLTPNKKRSKPLTLELRMNENHISLSYGFALLLNRMVRASIERNCNSPKLDDPSNTIFSAIKRAIQRSIDRRTSLYYNMNELIPTIRFEPGREIPGLDTVYPTWDDFWEDIFKEYRARYPPMRRFLKFYKHKGIPSMNPRSLWNLFAPKGEFSWEQDIPSK